MASFPTGVPISSPRIVSVTEVNGWYFANCARPCAIESVGTTNSAPQKGPEPGSHLPGSMKQQTDEDERTDRQAVRERVELRVDRPADVVAADHVIDVMTDRREHGERDEAAEGSHRDVRSHFHHASLHCSRATFSPLGLHLYTPAPVVALATHVPRGSIERSGGGESR
jgi:hypothetical protein